ncbi:MAG: hypothetical protein HWN65_14955 [Candidatus Helarchaeota archaeon]|nr:hypothetical protein [Candidatus Helarchaeota archaeon]
MQFDLVNLLITLALALPGISVFLWKLSDRAKEQRLMAEKFKPLLKIEYPFEYDLTGYSDSIDGAIKITNIGDLTTDIKNLNLTIRLGDPWEISLKRLKFRDWDNTDVKLPRGLRIVAEEHAGVMTVDYSPKESGNVIRIKPTETAEFPLEIQYSKGGTSTFEVLCTVQAGILDPKSKEAVEAYQKLTEEIQKKAEAELKKRKDFYFTLYRLYNQVFSKYKELQTTSSPDESDPPMAEKLINYLIRFMDDLKSIGENYQLKEITEFAEDVITYEKARQFRFRPIRRTLLAYLEDITNATERLINRAVFEEIEEDQALVRPLLNFRAKLIKGEKTESLIEILHEINSYFDVKTQDFGKEQYKVEIISKIKKEISKLIEDPAENLEPSELKGRNLEKSIRWEFWEEDITLENKYRDAYKKHIFKIEKPKEFDEYFQKFPIVSRPELEGSITDMEFEYEVVRHNNEKFLLGRLIVENKRNERVRFQGQYLKLKQIPGVPSIRFYNEETGEFVETLDLLQTRELGNRLDVRAGEFGYTNLTKVKMWTFPKLIDAFYFVQKIEGTGFFELHWKIASAPIFSDREYRAIAWDDDAFYDSRFSNTNNEQFYGYVGSMGEAPPEILVKSGKVVPPSQSTSKPSAPNPPEASALDEAFDILTTPGKAATPGKTVTIRCSNCNSEVTVDPTIQKYCPDCGKEL